MDIAGLRCQIFRYRRTSKYDDHEAVYVRGDSSMMGYILPDQTDSKSPVACDLRNQYLAKDRAKLATGG